MLSGLRGGSGEVNQTITLGLNEPFSSEDVMTQLTTAIRPPIGIPMFPAIAGMHRTPAHASHKTREAVRKHLVDRLYKKIPFSLACELHERLFSGDYSHETRRMLREALLLAKAKTAKHA